jgi:hypothetical protein
MDPVKVQQHRVVMKMANFANQLASVAAHEPNPQNRVAVQQGRYRTMYYDPKTEVIHWIPYMGIVRDGGYPEVRNADFHYAMEMGIFQDDTVPVDPNLARQAGFAGDHFYQLNVSTLRNVMEKMQEDMRATERGYEAWNWLGSKMDQIHGHAASPGNGPAFSASTNPLSGR